MVVHDGVAQKISQIIYKRVIDLCLGSIILLMLTPLMGVIAMLVLVLDGRPIIYRQNRTGINGTAFIMYKFRTMRCGNGCDPFRQTERNDPRVTPLGKWLRRISLDELPQLINVLNGDMSLVGPRPHAVEMDQELRTTMSNYALRYHTQPGITGWAQVNGYRGAANTAEKIARRIEYDLYYINNQSIAMDIKILMMTLWVIFYDQDNR